MDSSRTLKEPTRIIKLDGPVNFRDLGGYRGMHGRSTPWRTLFRSDGLDSLTAADCAILEDHIGLGVVIDLRTEDEVNAVGSAQGTLRSAEYHHLPIMDQTKHMLISVHAGRTMAELYVEMAANSGTYVAQTVRVIAQSRGPAVFHCAAGKDRTGLIAAVVLDLLGVSDQDITADYALSAAILPILRARWDLRMKEVGQAGDNPGVGTQNSATTGWTSNDWDRAGTAMLSARVSTIETLVHTLRTDHGSIEGWLRAQGLTSADLAMFRNRLLG